MRRGVMAGIVLFALTVWLAVPAHAAGEQGSIRVVMPPDMAGRTVTLYSVGEAGGGEWTLAGEYASGWEQRLSEEGTAMFQGLAEGRYLLTMENMASVEVHLPEADGSWMAEIAPGMVYIAPATGQPVEPVLWAMGMVLSAFGIGIWYENWHKKRKK